ncbi:type II restriction enzyme [Methanoregula sp.]|uniref:type II restriction enzyme n=1 Tax=Methanoregula sp. TaxID=2052170 RepID=UPI003BB11D6A
MTQNDAAWGKIFECLPLLPEIERQGYVYVSAEDIKKASDKREPRLLAKQDTKNSRPDVFKHNNLSILPVENGKYIIFRDDPVKTYYPLEKILAEVPVEEYQPVKDYREYQSLDVRNLSSESQAIDFANLVSLLKTFTNEKELNLTIRGRQRSEKFRVVIPGNHHTVEVEGVQIEVDAGYESPEKIYIFEAKLGRVEDFNIRQLYYPFKDWSCKSTKEIIPLFFVYTNGLFYIIQFAFGEEYGELRCVKSKCFTVNEPAKQPLNLKQLLAESRTEPEPDVPYPQANDLDKVIDIITNFHSAGLTNKPAIAEFFDFDERQGDYYANAGYYLGLLKRVPSSTEFELTREGEFIAKSENRSRRNLLLLKQMLKRPSFNEVIRLFESKNRDLSLLGVDVLAPIIQKHVELNETTASRRASTVMSWMRWVNNNMDFG